MANLEARARWHLAIGYPPPGEEEPALDDDDYEGEYLGSITCWSCGGEGTRVDCMDDLCHGQGFCMHGDNRMCGVCYGEGML
ncbi:hypothetical protein [Hydrogenophaga sp. 2FB]|uniref:hypothetical protein n=1 Tax=Hydrogenophaga sp. 2FB TaxID=2502187 RepID=UPI0010F4A3DE|nr:hypothetical protein [Hydrogenophaga sp. 2FB]